MIQLHCESTTVKKILKSDSICESYAHVETGPVFWLTVQCISVRDMYYSVCHQCLYNNNIKQKLPNVKHVRNDKFD